MTLSERHQISAFLVLGKSKREIGRILNRSHSIIIREIKRNSRPHPHMRGYLGGLADKQSKTRKSEASQRPRLKNRTIRDYVHDKLELEWTPEQISGSLLKNNGLSISHEAIYQYIYYEYKEGIKYLPRKHPKRYPKNYCRKRHMPSIPQRVSIKNRPAGINNRWYFGHWETDSIESRQSRSIINVNIERKSRYIQLRKLPSKCSEDTHAAISELLLKYPKEARQSITYDNGSETYGHLKTNEKLGAKSYFCEPYHSWEKGAVENINSLIRRFIPKKTDLSKITNEELKKIENLLNNRPRKCLGYKTPSEVFSKYCKQKV